MRHFIARRSVLSACVAAAVTGLAGSPAAGTAVNIMETASGAQNLHYVYTYNTSGTRLSTVQIPESPSGYRQPHDLVVDKAGNIQVVYGGPYLATYNGSGWTFRQALNWGLFGVTYTGGITAYNSYVYCQSQGTSSARNGILRFDTANNYSYSMTYLPNPGGGNYEPQDVAMGMDGLLYANYYIGAVSGHRVVGFNPDTMAVVRTVNLTYGDRDGDHSVVDAQGNVYAMGYGYLNKYGPNGAFVKNIALDGHGDLDISDDGKLLTTQGSTAYVFDTDLNMLSQSAINSAYWGAPFTAWSTYQTPVPEPAAAAGMAALAAGLLRGRRARAAVGPAQVPA